MRPNHINPAPAHRKEYEHTMASLLGAAVFAANAAIHFWFGRFFVTAANVGGPFDSELQST
jgi:hypothetical protein